MCARAAWRAIVQNASPVLRLLKPYGSNDKGNACYLIDWNVERRVFFIVGNGCEETFLFTWHKPFYENALLPCCDNVTLIPLQELPIFEYRAGYHISRVEMRIHGKT